MIRILLPFFGLKMSLSIGEIEAEEHRNVMYILHPNKLSYGNGDVHLPLGWGSIPFEEVFSKIKLPNNATFNFELQERHKHYWKKSLDILRSFLNNSNDNYFLSTIELIHHHVSHTPANNSCGMIK